MTSDEVRLLRCEINRIVILAGNDKISLPTVRDSSLIDAPMYDAAIQAAGFVTTMWQLKILRMLGNSPVFNTIYDTVDAFVDNPSLAKLNSSGLNIATLFAAVATFRGVVDPCLFKVTMPGLVPPSPLVMPIVQPVVPGQPDPPPLVIPEPPASSLRHRMRYSEGFGWFMFGALGLSTVGTIGISILDSMQPPRREY
jgi:hypothetical protein